MTLRRCLQLIYRRGGFFLSRHCRIQRPQTRHNRFQLRQRKQCHSQTIKAFAAAFGIIFQQFRQDRQFLFHLCFKGGLFS